MGTSGCLSACARSASRCSRLYSRGIAAGPAASVIASPSAPKTGAEALYRAPVAEALYRAPRSPSAPKTIVRASASISRGAVSSTGRAPPAAVREGRRCEADSTIGRESVALVWNQWHSYVISGTLVQPDAWPHGLSETRRTLSATRQNQRGHGAIAISEAMGPLHSPAMPVARWADGNRRRPSPDGS